MGLKADFESLFFSECCADLSVLKCGTNSRGGQNYRVNGRIKLGENFSELRKTFSVNEEFSPSGHV